MVDFSDQMSDLATMYSEKRHYVLEREKKKFQEMLIQMRSFIKCFDERIEIDRKMESLKDKLEAVAERCEHCNESNEDEE